MASIVLGRYEAEEGNLPDVCMSCGEPAMERKRRRFVSHPFWIYFLLPLGWLPYVIVAAVLTVRVKCYTFFCDRHKNHWRVRSFIIWGSFLAIVVLILGSFFAVALVGEKAGKSFFDNVMGFLCIGSLVLMFAWLISIPIVQLFAIHTSNVTERRVTLERVSPVFVDAVRKHREKQELLEVEEA